MKRIEIQREAPRTEVSCVQGERHSAGLRLSKTTTNRELQIVLNFFVNCSKNSVSTHEHFGIQICHTMMTLLHFHFFFKVDGNASKTRIFFIFLCTVNIQSIDRGTYIQFGTHGSDQQKDFITFKRSAGWQVPT